MFIEPSDKLKKILIWIWVLIYLIFANSGFSFLQLIAWKFETDDAEVAEKFMKTNLSNVIHLALEG